MTAANVAETIYGKPSKAQVEKARRKLEKLVKDGHAAKINGRQTSDPTVYRPIASVRVREGSREGVTGASRLSRNPVNIGHAPLTDHERSGLHTTCVVDRDPGRDSEALADWTDTELQATLADSHEEVG